jgi:TPR repeat protein
MSGSFGVAARLSAVVCMVLGLAAGSALGDPAAPSPSKLEEACTAGDVRSCNKLGDLYADGRGVAKDERRAATLYEKACTVGLAEGCYNLGTLYTAGLGVTKDEGRAASLYEMACKGGDPLACYKRAAALFKESCQAGISEACTGR